MALKVLGQNGLEVVNRHHKIGSVTYFWPAAAGAGVLLSDASGNLSWDNAPTLSALAVSTNISVGTSIAQAAGNNFFNTSSGNTNIGFATDQGYKLTVGGGLRILANSTINGLVMTGTAAASAAGNGAAALDLINIVGTAGQATSSVTGPQSGGAGANIVMTAGAGGASTGATGAVHGGDAGGFILSGAVGGAAASTSGTGGQGGTAVFTGGTGGAVSAASGATLGGIGGSATLIGGPGGAVASASGVGGLGASAVVCGGAGGANSGGGAAGNAGSVLLAHTGGVARGGVAVRLAAASTSLHVKQIANTNTGGLRLERSDASNRWDNYIDGSDNLIWFFNGTSTGFYANSSGQLVAVGRIFSGAGFNGILGSDLAASPARGNKLQWNDANSAMEWATVSNVSNFSCILGSNQVHSSPSTFIKANLSAAQFDGLAEFDSTNHRLVIKRAGTYVFFASMYANGPAANTRLIMSVFVNSVERLRLFDWTTGIVTDYIPSAGGITQLAASDVVELYLFQTAASTTFVANYTKLDGFRVA